mgnify:CR=1 FL=1
MKKIIYGNELYDKMSEAINLLCNTVKITLGPKGNNVIIDHSSFSPFITNDGVTIAENIESEDEVINTILTLAKEASIKTNDIVGDGTTTTLVLLEGIFNEGLKLIKEGYNPIILKKELNTYLDKLIIELENISHIPTNKELFNVAKTSSNDNLIAKNIYDAYIKTKNINAINIKEIDSNTSHIEYLNGYRFETVLASNYFLNEQNTIEYNNSNILIINNKLENIESIAEILNEVIKNNESLIIISDDYNDDVVNDLVSLYLSNEIKICLLKTPSYGHKAHEILKDISVITNSNIIKTDYITLNDLGKVNNIVINNEEIIISFDYNDNIKKLIKEIKSNNENEIEKNFNDLRISMLSTTVANILVGATTTTERRELKMRYIDALHAIDISTKGKLPGAGIALLKLRSNIKLESDIDKLFYNVLYLPFKQILINSGLDDKEIYDNIKKYDFNKLYNINKSNYENINDTLVIDPTFVVLNALKNAVSISSMLLTTSHLIINEYKNNLNKITDYNEM